jgi:hypothetical protein
MAAARECSLRSFEYNLFLPPLLFILFFVSCGPAQISLVVAAHYIRLVGPHPIILY